jgi:glycosyltransferase involved in cell wall biosynthesis
MESAGGFVKNLVSVILPIRKGEDISELIKSIKTSSYPHIEIIMVDEGFERSKQRNIGITRAAGEFLLIVDSDWILHPFLIAECRSLMYTHDAVYIPEIIITKGLFAYIRNWERQFYTATPIDVVRFLRHKDCPEFDETLHGPEDSSWDREIKGKRVISKTPYYHNDNVSMIKWFCKKAYYCKSMKHFSEKHPGDKTLDWKWRCIMVFLEHGKWKRFIKRPDLALAVLAMIFVRGIIYKMNK